MRAQQRLSKLEQQIVPPLPCTCKELLVTQENGCEVVTLPACDRHKRKEAAEVLRMCNVSVHDL